mgnify:FL=1
MYAFKPTYLLLSFFLTSIFYNSYSQLKKKKNGMVVSDSKLASEIGVKILKSGGNAVDASIASAFALAVTYPAAGNIGGGGFVVYFNAEKESVTTIDFREKAPLKSYEKMYIDETGQFQTKKSSYGIRSIGVPGTVDGLYHFHKKYGKLPWKVLIQPSIDLSKDGFKMTNGLFNSIKNQNFHQSKKYLKTYFNNKNGNLVKPGELWIQESLSKTLTAIRDNGRDGFYKGWVADEIVNFMKKNNGLIDHNDLIKYKSTERIPVRGNYRGFEVFSMPPPSSGGITLISMLNILENEDFKKIKLNSTMFIHLLVETMKIGFYNRAKYLGDPDFNPNIPIDSLLSKKYSKIMFKSINKKKASKSDPNVLNKNSESDQTTHISVIDKDGSSVSLTYTLEESFGSGIGTNKLGFLFNNEMGDFNPVPGLTDKFGLIGTKPNTIAPGKRMLSSMTPTIVTKNMKPYLIIGSPGGRTIINTVLQSIINTIDYNMNLDDAIEASKFHHQWLPDKIVFEKSKFSSETLNDLSKMGHDFNFTTRLGNLMGIIYDEKENIFIGATDSASSDGAAIGY